MPVNNNQKGQQSAAARLCGLPVVHTACRKLSVLYTDAKHSHPHLRAACQALENSVTVLCSVASQRVSPVVVILEPQISTANDVACKSLDWLEIRFPVLHAPTEQIVATAKNKVQEVRGAVSVAANGTVSCVQHTVTWVLTRMQQADDGQTAVERAVGVATEGLGCALTVAEALVDRMLPPTEQDKAAVHLGSESAALRSFPVRLVSLTVKLCRRTRHMVETKIHSVQVTEPSWWSSALVLNVQTAWLTWLLRLQQLPQSLQHQAVSVLFFFSQMFDSNSATQTPQQNRPQLESHHLGAAEASTPQREAVQLHSRATPLSHRTRAIKGSEKKGCGRR